MVQSPSVIAPDTDVRKMILAEGGDIVPITPEEFAELIRKELPLWAGD